MTDTRTVEVRSKIMASVGQKNTGPEMVVRRLLHRLGYRYRLHAKELPGRPDIVFRPRRKAIYVHGCFWHGHGCSKGKLPKSKLEYWGPKISRNAKRDKENVSEVRKLGWDVMVIWQCELGNEAELQGRLESFLGSRAET
jgi:DNA mismatch endonuclease (patch repair protein)